MTDTAKEDDKAMVNLFLGLWLFVRLWDQCFVQPFPSLPGFKDGGFGFHEGDALITH